MSFYQRRILPALLDFAMRQQELEDRRRELVPRASGRVLEVGVGSGLNLAFYGPGATQVHGIDSSLELLRKARRATEDASVPVRLIAGTAEALPVPDAALDTVVMTWTLCSIANPGRALDEIRRVLKPQGRLLFVEHGLSPEEPVARWQRRLDPLWRRLAGGCHLSRKIDDLIRDAGFELEGLATGYMPGPRFAAFGRFLYQGAARRA
jgi:ubiquinone/menaquinone biosynthesis C-methylase UbiE